MGPSITLIGRGKYGEVVHSLTLPLSTGRFEYSIQDTLEIVYQDISYEYRITGLTKNKNVLVYCISTTILLNSSVYSKRPFTWMITMYI